MSLGAPAYSRPVGSRKSKLAGETPVVAWLCPGKPAIPGIATVMDRRYSFPKTSRIESKTARIIFCNCAFVVQ